MSALPTEDSRLPVNSLRNCADSRSGVMSVSSFTSPL